METSFIENEELLYRAIKYNGHGIHSDELKGLIVTHMAFLDRQNQPSVDRAILCNNDPQYSQVESTDGVVCLHTRDVRKIDPIETKNNKGKTEIKHNIDVIHRPLSDNYAHAQIEAAPEISSSKAFKRLRTALAWKVNNQDKHPRWLIYPEGHRK